MDFELSDERRMLADTASRYIAQSYPLKARLEAAASEPGWQPAMWQSFADLGLIGALVPAHAEGLGGLGDDIAVVFEQLGRGLVNEPFLAVATGAHAIAAAGTPAQQALLADVIAGSRLITFAHAEPEGRYTSAHVATTARRDGDGWLINGRKSVVINGDSADHLVVSARLSGDVTDEAGAALFLIDGTATGVSRRGYGTIDGGRAAEILFDGVLVGSDALIGDAGAGFALIEQTLARGALAVSAEAIGIMDVSRDLTLDYLKTRTQFGRTIGSFQVLQHRMVDLTLEIEQARSAVMLAASLLDGERIARERAISAAKNLIGRVGRLVAEETIQLHGGIAMTWDYALPHYAKRLVMIDHQFGDTDHHLVRFSELGRTSSA
ncbi:MAG: acyl-CoA dehydrogenase family protein [Hyphomicrobiaceae bacterium]